MNLFPRKQDEAAERERQYLLNENRVQESILGLRPADVSDLDTGKLRRRVTTLKKVNAQCIDPNDPETQPDPWYPFKGR